MAIEFGSPEANRILGNDGPAAQLKEAIAQLKFSRRDKLPLDIGPLQLYCLEKEIESREEALNRLAG